MKREKHVIMFFFSVVPFVYVKWKFPLLYVTQMSDAGKIWDKGKASYTALYKRGNLHYSGYQLSNNDDKA